jgi:hypothetical protein
MFLFCFSDFFLQQKSSLEKECVCAESYDHLAQYFLWKKRVNTFNGYMLLLVALQKHNRNYSESGNALLELASQ